MHRKRLVSMNPSLALISVTVGCVVFAVAAIAAEAPVGANADSAQSTPEPKPPARPLLYCFEHHSLPQSALRYEPEVQALIANPRQADDPVRRLFAEATLCAARLPNFNEDTWADDIKRFMSQISFETIRRGGYTIHLMGMPPPEFPPEAYFVAIVYKDDEPLVEGEPAPSSRYITLEKTSVPGRAFALGEWNAQGEHKTHGFGDHQPTVRDLIVNVYAMLGISPPGALGAGAGGASR